MFVCQKFLILRFGDLEEKVGVEAFALEDVIYVGAFATDFAGES